ncbi:MAG: hypothetical protein QW500_00335, partial [Candidatus Micrarchaeia archaeon]
MVVAMVLFGEEPESTAASSILRIAGSFPNDWKVKLASLRDINELSESEKNLLVSNCDFEFIFNNEIFRRKLSDEEIVNAQKILGYSIPLLLESSHYQKYNLKIWNKKHIEFIAQLVYYWNDFLSRVRPDVIISIYECKYPYSVLYQLAKRKGIKLLHIAVSRFGNSLIILDNNLHPVFYRRLGNEEINHYYEECFMKINGKIAKADLSKIRGRFRLPNFVKCVDYFRKYYSLNKWFQMTVPGFWQLSIRYITKMIRAMIVPLLYKEADLNKKYFVFYLSHFDEATNSLHYNMYDQYELVKVISRSLPSGYFLYVKPHPHYNGNNVEIKRLLEILRLDNVKFIRAKTDPSKLIKNCVGVITIGATSGMEAMFFDKPVLCFGDPFYANKYTAVLIRDFSKLPYQLAEIIADWGSSFDKIKRKEIISTYYAHQIHIDNRISV